MHHSLTAHLDDAYCCDSYDVRDEFFELFQYKAGLFVWEVLSVIMTPYVLCFKLPDCAENIVKFVGDHTVDVEGSCATIKLVQLDYGLTALPVVTFHYI